LAQTHDHEIVSIYPFSGGEVDQLMNNSNECVLMWATKDGWPVGVTHTFLWHDQKIWLTFASHRHRAEAIRRDSRVSVNVSSAGYSPRAAKDLPTGAITFKGRGEFFDDEKTKRWFYPALSEKLSPTNEGAAKFFEGFLDSPLRTILAITPEKKIMYNSRNADRHVAGTISDEELGDRLPSDAVRMNAERGRRGLDPR
jgi:general stress protein 26